MIKGYKEASPLDCLRTLVFGLGLGSLISAATLSLIYLISAVVLQDRLITASKSVLACHLDRAAMFATVISVLYFIAASSYVVYQVVGVWDKVWAVGCTIATKIAKNILM